MPKDYQPKKSKFSLPNNLYMATLYIIRDYERVQKAYEDLVHDRYYHTHGLPLDTKSLLSIDRADNPHISADNVETRRMHAVSQALNQVPSDIQRGLLNNICERIPFPDIPSYGAWKYHRQKFIYHVCALMQWY